MHVGQDGISRALPSGMQWLRSKGVSSTWKNEWQMATWHFCKSSATRVERRSKTDLKREGMSEKKTGHQLWLVICHWASEARLRSSGCFFGWRGQTGSPRQDFGPIIVSRRIEESDFQSVSSGKVRKATFALEGQRLDLGKFLWHQGLEPQCRA